MGTSTAGQGTGSEQGGDGQGREESSLTGDVRKVRTRVEGRKEGEGRKRGRRRDACKVWYVCVEQGEGGGNYEVIKKNKRGPAHTRG